MSTITIKSVPPEIHRELKFKATLHHRSLNNEIINNLEESLGWHQIKDADIRVEAEKMRKKFSLNITGKQLKKFKEQGRL